jgi:hypothetical protein
VEFEPCLPVTAAKTAQQAILTELRMQRANTALATQINKDALLSLLSQPGQPSGIRSVRHVTCQGGTPENSQQAKSAMPGMLNASKAKEGTTTMHQPSMTLTHAKGF